MNDEISALKQEMYAMRNGVIADALRQSNPPYRTIFGLNLPQIVEIARRHKPDADLARALYRDQLREARLIAPMLFPVDELTQDEALQWILEVGCVEVADILCHRLLRHQAWAVDLASRLLTSATPLMRYVALRLLFNLLPANAAVTIQAAKAEQQKQEPVTYGISTALIDEITMLKDD